MILTGVGTVDTYFTFYMQIFIIDLTRKMRERWKQNFSKEIQKKVDSLLCANY